MIALIESELFFTERLGFVLVLTVPQRIKCNIVLAVVARYTSGTKLSRSYT